MWLACLMGFWYLYLCLCLVPVPATRRIGWTLYFVSAVETGSALSEHTAVGVSCCAYCVIPRCCRSVVSVIASEVSVCITRHHRSQVSMSAERASWSGVLPQRLVSSKLLNGCWSSHRPGLRVAKKARARSESRGLQICVNGEVRISA